MAPESAEKSHIRMNYIQTHLLPEIVEKLPNETLESFEVDESISLDSFMSAIYTIRLKTKHNESIKERVLIAKFMKGAEEFRKTSKSYTQFANEVYIYNTVLPAIEEVLKASNANGVSVENLVASSYKAAYGYIAGLSEHADALEAVLVLENLKPLGYVMGPGLFLNNEHLKSMCKSIGEFHAFSYVLRLSDNERFQRLVEGIEPLSFLNSAQAENDVFGTVYRIAFDRFYEFFNRKVRENFFNTKDCDASFVNAIKRLEKKYFKNPASLMEFIRTNSIMDELDAKFAAILHGDYNRNNVLFCYENQQLAEGMSKVANAKMIDFQMLRYGTPAIDLSFFLFLNSTAEQRTFENWLELLQTYHAHMFGTMSSVLKSLAKSEEQLQLLQLQLKDYSFDNFNRHFKRYAFYGAMVTMNFLPWLIGTEAERAHISKLWEIDMHSAEFHKSVMKVGGDAVSFKILNVVRHAFNMGYLDFLLT